MDFKKYLQLILLLTPLVLLIGCQNKSKKLVFRDGMIIELGSIEPEELYKSHDVKNAFSSGPTEDRHLYCSPRDSQYLLLILMIKKDRIKYVQIVTKDTTYFPIEKLVIDGEGKLVSNKIFEPNRFRNTEIINNILIAKKKQTVGHYQISYIDLSQIPDDFQQVF